MEEPKANVVRVKNILVSQPQPPEFEKSPYYSISKKFNCNIEFFKLFQIEGIPARDFRKDRVHILDFTAVIFTSRNAIDHFFRICTEMRIEVPDTMKYFALSESTAYYLQKYVQYRKRKIFYGKQTFAELMDVIKKHKTEKFLLPCSDVQKLDITKQLDSAKINYKRAIIYRTIPIDATHMNINDFDMIVFFSPQGVASLMKNFPDYKQGDTLIAGFGPTTAKAIKDHGLTLNIPAPTKTAPSMTMAIEQFLEKNAANNKKK